VSVSGAVVSQPSDTLTDVVSSDSQLTEQYKPRNARTDILKSDIQPIEPREHRRPNRPGIIWAAGSRLEARDFLKKWYATLHPKVISGKTSETVLR